MRKIGIFGGSFDPIHYGHLRPALEIFDALSLDSLRFIPAGRPPHRETPVASAELRLAMVKAAVAEEPRFSVDARELKRQAPSYSVDTLTDLRREFPGDTLALIVGMDAFLGFTSWHRWQEILGLAHVVVMHRPGAAPPNQGPLAALLQEHRVADARAAVSKPAGSVLLHAVTQLEISSSRIRELAARKGELRYLVPEPVRELILNSACYGKET